MRKFDFRVKRLENVRKGKPYIFCPNHQTHFDGLFVWTALGNKCPDTNNIWCMAKVELLDNMLTSLMMRTLGGIPVERTGNTIDSMQRSIDFIKEGNSFLIHPEGTRTRTGELGSFKEGAARIAMESGMTIIPVAIQGGYEIWPYNRTLPEAKNRITGQKRIITVTFCEEVETIGREANFISRSVQLREDIYMRLKTFEVQKSQYTKTALLNQLLDSALKLYGF